MSQWYLSKNGQALGPLEEDKIVALIREGELSPVDLVYEMGATEWIPISKVDTFAIHFKKKEEETSGTGEGSKEWVILKKVVSEKGQEYTHLGPLTVAHVFKMIDQGEAKFTDFAWKQGMETWVKISEISEFDDPLPSSPPVDTSIYEKTNVDIDVSEETVVDKEQKASLTELVNIEHFQHERTMVQPNQAEEIQKLVEARKKAKAEAKEDGKGVSHREEVEDDERTSDLDSAEGELFTEISEVTPIPINEESFVTDSEITSVDSSGSDVSLWSLEPPKTGKTTDGEDVDEAVDSKTKRKEEVKSKKKKPKPKSKPKKKPKPKKDREPIQFPLAGMSTESWQWIGVISFVLFAFFLFYQSLTLSTDPIEYDESQQYDADSNMFIDSKPEAYRESEVDEKMADYRSRLNQGRTRNRPEVAPAPPQPKVPIAEKIPKRVAKTERKVLSKPPVKKVVAKPKAQPKPQQPTKTRNVAGKKQVIQSRARLMQQTKKKALPPKSTPKKTTPPKTVQKKAIKRSTSTSPRVKKVAGGPKNQSYFKQRDRMALFYSSLKAETLAVEIANQYKKLKGSRTAWNRYYGQWRKKVQASLARDIRDFPKRNETYAYPKVLAEFKKDYNMFYKYGESFDAKIKGNRNPSGGPSNMRQIFSRYKKQAQSLGR